MLQLILGGARSGKSRLAEQTAKESSQSVLKNNLSKHFKQDTEKMYTSNITYLPYLIYNDLQ